MGGDTMSYKTETQLYPGYTYLTPRQAQVLRLSLDGLETRSIAAQLNVSQQRVRYIKQLIKQKAAGSKGK